MDHSKWEFLQYEIGNSPFFSKNLVETEYTQSNHENRIKTLEQNLKTENYLKTYNLCKLELKNIYDKMADGAKICSKCEWYQQGKKPIKVYFAKKAINKAVRQLIEDAKDIIYLQEVNTYIFRFYKKLFKKNVSKLDLEKDSFLNSIHLPSLTSKHFDICEIEITKKNLIPALKSRFNSKFWA